jgi:hypothetical protein
LSSGSASSSSSSTACDASCRDFVDGTSTYDKLCPSAQTQVQQLATCLCAACSQSACMPSTNCTESFLNQWPSVSSVADEDCRNCVTDLKVTGGTGSCPSSVSACFP